MLFDVAFLLADTTVFNFYVKRYLHMKELLYYYLVNTMMNKIYLVFRVSCFVLKLNKFFNVNVTLLLIRYHVLAFLRKNDFSLFVINIEQ